MTKQKLWSYNSSMQLIHQPNSVDMTISIPCLLEMITTLTISAMDHVPSSNRFRRMARSFIISR